MKLKTVTVGDKTYAELSSEGFPVYIHGDGKEVGFDAPSAVAKISSLNGEAMGHRTAKETLEAKLRAFEGIEDAEAAKQALETVKNIKDGELIAAGKVAEIKEAARLAAEERVAQANKANSEALAAVTKERDDVRNTYHRELISGGFSRSKFIAEKGSVPADIFEARFSNQFKIENNKVIGYDTTGNQIYSLTRPGEVAEFEEALEIMVDKYPYRASLLKGTGGGGGGQGGKGGGGLGDKTLSRKEFDALHPLEQNKRMREGYKVVDAAA